MLLPLALFCAVSFLGYGIGCLVTAHMAAEFERYRLARFRALTGVLQILGGLGVLAGLQVPAIGALAAGGLAVLMLLGFGVRLKIHDGILLSLPSLFYLVLSTWICAEFVGQVAR